MFRSCVTALTLAMTVSFAFAESEETQPHPSPGTSFSSLSSPLPQNSLTASDSFRTTQPVLIEYLSPEDVTSSPHQTLLPKDAEVTALEWTQVDGFGAAVRIGIDIRDLEEGEYPSDVLITESAYGTLPLAELDALSLEENALLGFEGGEEYAEAIAAVEASRRGSARSSRGRSRGMTYCYRNVKKALLKKGLVDTYLPGGSAYMAKDVLPDHGFKRLRVSHPEKAKDGAICVYDRDSRNRHGHIEIKRSDDCYWYGYGCKAKSMYDSRDFVDCYAKPKERWWASKDKGDKKNGSRTAKNEEPKRNSVRENNSRIIN